MAQLIAERHRVGRRNDFHTHTLHEILVCLNDHGEQVVDDQRFPFKRGRSFFLPEFSRHRVTATARAPADLIYICFEPTLALERGHEEVERLLRDLVAGRRWVATPPAGEAERVVRSAEDIVAEAARPRPWHDSMGIALLVELLVRHARAAAARAADDAGDDAIAALCRTLAAAPQRRVTLVEAARRCGMSRAGFARAFHERHGMSFVPFLHRLRVRHAQRLLADGDAEVAAVAAAAGFANAGHFHQIFKRETGLSPARYRRWTRERGGAAPRLRVDDG